MAGRCLVLVVLAIAAGAMRAGQAAGADQVLPTVTRMGVALDQPRGMVGGQVDVITRAEIDRSGAGDIGQLLRRMAGIVIDRGAGDGGFASLYLRGADPSHVVVLVDGVRQNDPLSSRGAAVDLNTIALADIERIEILRGPVAAAGDTALAGVIHIVTRERAAGGSRAKLRLGAGGGGHHDGFARLRHGGQQIAAFAGEEGEGGLSGHARIRGVSGAHRFDLGSALTLMANWRAAQARSEGAPDDSGGPLRAVRREPERRESEVAQLSTQLLSDPSGWRLAFTAVQRDSDEMSPGVAPGLRDPMGLPGHVADGRYRRQQLAWHQAIRSASPWTFEWGADAEHESGRLDSELFFGVWLPASFSLDRDRVSIFARSRRGGDALSLDAGLRAVHDDGGSLSWQPALGLLWTPADSDWQLGADAAATRQRPSFYALGSPLVGNPALRDERARQLELHASWDPHHDWRLRLAAYRAQYRDLVDFDAGPPPRLVNRSRVDVLGIEGRLDWRVADDWTLSAQGNWMDVDTGEAGVELRHRPRAQASLDIDGTLSDAWRLHGSLRWLGSRWDSSVPTGDRELSPYAVLDLSLRYRARRWDLFVAADNLLDRDYEHVIGLPAPSRRVRVGAEWRF